MKRPPELAGRLFVISAPSGAGKSTVGRRVVAELSGLGFSISYTTRAPREGETDGYDYYFVDRERFDRRVEDGRFLEWAEVHGNRYGTDLPATEQLLAGGADLLLDIDVQGARQVREGPIRSVSIMILPPDFQTLESRLTGRGSETDEQRRRRLAKARAEVGEYENFDFVVVNDDLDRAVDEAAAIVKAERRRSGRCKAEASRILATFPEA